jgi:flagellin FlaB
MVGIEAAIVLISFVIVAAAFSFMVVNMGLFSTQRGRETIQQGVSESSSPLILDGNIMLRATSATPARVDAMMIPLKTMGVRYVSMSQNTSEISLGIENDIAYADVYYGINATYEPLNTQLSTLVDATRNQTGNITSAQLFVGNTDGDSSLDYDEKGFLVFCFATAEQAAEREHILVEIRPEKGAPISIEVVVPPQLTEGWLTVGG